MIALVISFIVVSLFLFVLFVGTYQRLVQIEKKVNEIERERTLMKDLLLSHNETISKYVEVTDYLLVKDGGAGVYMGERGDA